MKITNREQLFTVLTDNYIDNDRADAISDSAYILSKGGFDKLLSRHEEIGMELGEDCVTLILDESITAIVDYLVGLTNDDIKTNFDMIYSNNVIATDEDGRGMLFIQG